MVCEPYLLYIAVVVLLVLIGASMGYGIGWAERLTSLKYKHWTQRIDCDEKTCLWNDENEITCEKPSIELEGSICLDFEKKLM